MLRQEWCSDMSKPVSNVEIEDVLSSIRRLVSNSDRVERVEHECKGCQALRTSWF